ncbi:hypothetical protein CPY53_01410 [Paenibacillus polymyxa]|nr:hypothetical protein TY89_23705 [Paenibacillus polymyxa]KKD54848.1 hypothetical protein C400_10215 [Paenibacillus sp. ICGEB2008]UNL92292.1 hypothetical protein CPY53_01410 [Paenibacillus polymyxa]
MSPHSWQTAGFQLWARAVPTGMAVLLLADLTIAILACRSGVDAQQNIQQRLRQTPNFTIK